VVCGSRHVVLLEAGKAKFIITRNNIEVDHVGDDGLEEELPPSTINIQTATQNGEILGEDLGTDMAPNGVRIVYPQIAGDRNGNARVKDKTSIKTGQSVNK
jgi:hypothetical protein